MSYDLMVFDPEAAPLVKNAKAFLPWYELQAKWNESHGYNDPEIPSPTLQLWFRDMIKSFPPLNGPLADDDNVDSPMTTDYCLGRQVIYACFGWSQSRFAYQNALELAAKYEIGFFDVSSTEGAVWLKSPKGGYEIAFYTNLPTD